ncbi:hypothetical protein RRF57_013136 [Xylaria bambusicola]|uniref:Uncharacterized protein n=1 Tax=Xylaria bambusicola TaxID=326684 RepID=A0AAN7V4Z3_9PEZI
MQIRHSRYGNIWHAVSQLISDDTKELLDAANNKADENVFEDDEDEDKHDFFKLATFENGRSEVLKHYPDMEPSGSSLVTRLREKLSKVISVKREHKQ